MTIRARIADNFLDDGIAVRVTQDHDGGYSGMPSRMVMRITPEGRATWEPYDEPSALPASGGSHLTMTMPEDVARALLDALTRWYHGAEDTRALRRDYDAERQRVDKLTDAVIGIAARPQFMPLAAEIRSSPGDH